MAPVRHMRRALAVPRGQPRWFLSQEAGYRCSVEVRRRVPRGPGGSMPPEREDARARQLEALRRYFAQLGQRDRPTVEAAEAQPTSERRRRPSRPWLLLTGLLVVVALVGGVFVGAVAWSDDRPVGGKPAPTATTTTTTAGSVASAACKTAVDRANAMLTSAVKLRRAVAEQARILRDPATRRLSGPSCWSSSPRRCRPAPASRPGSTAPWPTTGRWWTGASCRPLKPGGQVSAPWWRRQSHWTGSGRRWRRMPRRRSPAAARG
jgi:hypothetical protein